jgi:murein DD-endopeptidase MepM/ murein hydrolase activator NlpD
MDETELGIGSRNAPNLREIFPESVTGWASRLRHHSMPDCLLQLPLALSLLAVTPTGTTEAGVRLPGGDSEAFRQKMTAWSARSEQPAPPILPVRRAASAIAPPRLSSGFGYRSDPLLGTRRMHSGIDIPGPLGTPVLASASGVVTFAGWAGGYGKMVEVDHGNGLRTRYGHLSRILVEPGIPIAQQQTVALMGSTGRSTGSHLHFEVRANGRAQNPLAFLHKNSPLPEPSFGWRTESLPHISQFARARSISRPQGEDGF